MPPIMRVADGVDKSRLRSKSHFAAQVLSDLIQRAERAQNVSESQLPRSVRNSSPHSMSHPRPYKYLAASRGFVNR